MAVTIDIKLKDGTTLKLSPEEGQEVYNQLSYFYSKGPVYPQQYFYPLPSIPQVPWRNPVTYQTSNTKYEN